MKQIIITRDYDWIYEGEEFERTLSGGVKGVNEEVARKNVLSALNLTNPKGKLTLKVIE